MWEEVGLGRQQVCAVNRVIRSRDASFYREELKRLVALVVLVAAESRQVERAAHPVPVHPLAGSC